MFNIKRNYDKCLLFIVCLLLLYIISTKIIDTNVWYKSSLNGKMYKVMNDGKEAVTANKLALVEYKLNHLCKIVCGPQGGSPHFMDGARGKLQSRWPKIKIREVSPGEPEAAYVLNKGPDMRFCVQNKETEIGEKDNLMMFVAIHEMAHIMSDSFGHGQEFLNNFKGLLDIATKNQIVNPLNGKRELIYTPKDFLSQPTQYCGTKINRNIM